MDAREPWLRLVHAPGLGPVRAQRLIERFGSVDAIFRADPDALRAEGLGADGIDALLGETAPAGVATDLDWARERGHDILTLADPRYPRRLASIADPPPAVYVHGDPEVLAYPALAIVGTRNPTPAGRDIAHDFAQHLASSGLIVVSGLALGIDAAAHRGALDGGGLTVATAGTGLDRVYPARNAALARAIADQGALLSELPVGTRPSRGAFPQRNRVLAGLCVGTLVIEAAARSGSLITARLALEQGREVFAVPGSIHNPVARGCHRLIRQGAKLVETADDVLEEIAGLVEMPASQAAPAGGDDRTHETEGPQDPHYAQLMAVLDWEPRGIDDLAARAGLDASSVASMLLRLELEGRVRVAPGGLYQRP